MNEEATPDAGFTLIETLVAFVILSGTIIMAFSAMSDSLQRMQRGRQIVEASKVAQEILARSSLAEPGQLVAGTGTQAGFRWQREVFPLNANADTATYPVVVKILISDLAGHSIPQASLDTILLVRQQP